MPDYLDDPRTAQVPFTRLKKHLRKSKAIPDAELDNASTKFALLHMAESAKVGLDDFLNGLGEPTPRGGTPRKSRAAGVAAAPFQPGSLHKKGGSRHGTPRKPAVSSSDDLMSNRETKQAMPLPSSHRSVFHASGGKAKEAPKPAPAAAPKAAPAAPPPKPAPAAPPPTKEKAAAPPKAPPPKAEAAPPAATATTAGAATATAAIGAATGASKATKADAAKAPAAQGAAADSHAAAHQLEGELAAKGLDAASTLQVGGACFERAVRQPSASDCF